MKEEEASGLSFILFEMRSRYRFHLTTNDVWSEEVPSPTLALLVLEVVGFKRRFSCLHKNVRYLTIVEILSKRPVPSVSNPSSLLFTTSTSSYSRLGTLGREKTWNESRRSRSLARRPLLIWKKEWKTIWLSCQSFFLSSCNYFSGSAAAQPLSLSLSSFSRGRIVAGK